MRDNGRLYEVIVVGGGIAGFCAAKAAAESGRTKPILLVSEEDRAPYKRTKISKKLAKGFEFDEFALEPPEWYAMRGIDLAVGQSVEAIDAPAHVIRLRSGDSFQYRRLVLAPGAEPIEPAGESQAAVGAYTIRTARDVEAVRSKLEQSASVAVIGNGVLGLEIAEQVSLMGKKVLLAGAGRRLLERHVDETISGKIEDLMRSHGIEVENSVRVSAFEGDLSGVRVDVGGTIRRFDVVLFCVGARPRVELARSAGVAVGRGIFVDDYLRTSDPDILAAGDAAQHSDGSVSFLWHSAEYQGELAGRNACGDLVEYDFKPFRLKCELFGGYFFGLNKPADPTGFEVLRSSDGECYRVFYFRDGRLAGVAMANDQERAKLYVQAVREHWSTEAVASSLPLGSLEPL
ncbi:MAG TPA: FAD-dependent oxidoreductase [Spirochaetia bacterium]|nr:FAD-dependent oxidoreductase [Spirochaetia bacterium]